MCGYCKYGNSLSLRFFFANLGRFMWNIHNNKQIKQKRDRRRERLRMGLEKLEENVKKKKVEKILNR